MTCQKLKVLVAEDNRINQKLISTVLTKLGINAVIVENGQLAVDYVKKENCRCHFNGLSDACFRWLSSNPTDKSYT